MSLYNPKMSITAAPGITGHLLMVLYEASSPNAPVAFSEQIPPPHNDSVQLQFNDLRAVVHLAKLFETDGIALTGTVLANFSLDPQISSYEVRPDLFIYGGVTPGFSVGDNKYVDADNTLEGWDYSLELRHAGTLDPDIEYEKDSLGNPTIQPGTEIAGGGTYQIFDNEVWVFHFLPRITTSTNSLTASAPFIVTEEITANRLLLPADIGKNFIIASSTTSIEITLPLVAAMVENKPTYFSSEGGNHKNAVIKTQGSDQIVFNGDRSNIILGQVERAAIYKWNGKLHLLNDLEGVKNVGQLFYSLITETPNSLWCNGQLVSRAIYARLWAFIQASVAPTLIVSDATWDTEANRGKFSTGDGSTTFRLPQLYDFLRGANGVRVPGTYQADQVKNSTRAMDFKQGKSDDNESGVSGEYLRKPGASGGSNYGDVSVNISYGDASATETNPKSQSFYICIKT